MSFMDRTRTMLLSALFLVSAGVVAPASLSQAAMGAGSGHLYFQRGDYIYAANADGGSVHQLTHTGTASQPDYQPAVSPDGTRLAYAQGRVQVNVVRVTGGAPVVVNRRAGVGNPTWSPDGRRLAVDMPNPCLTPVYNGPDIMSSRSVIAIGSASKNSFQSVYDGTACAVFRLYPVWSPDGGAFIVTENEDGKDARGRYESLGLDTIDVKSAKDTQITPQDRYDYLRPAYSPDGRYLACIRRPLGHKGQGSLWLLDKDGKGGHQLAAGADVTRPAWSLDGATIAYGASGGVYAVPAAGGPARLLVSNASYPAWGR